MIAKSPKKSYLCPVSLFSRSSKGPTLAAAMDLRLRQFSSTSEDLGDQRRRLPREQRRLQGPAQETSTAASATGCSEEGPPPDPSLSPHRQSRSRRPEDDIRHCQVEADGSKSLALSNYPYIFMRWNEQCFVNVGIDCGLMITGFYYVCFSFSGGSCQYFIMIQIAGLLRYKLYKCMKDLSKNDYDLCFATCKTQILRCLPFQKATCGGKNYLDGCYLRSIELGQQDNNM